MVTVKDSKWKQFWNEWNLTKKSKEVLFSYTKKINDIDPLQFFMNSKKQFKGQRFFWTNRSRNELYIGLGNATQIYFQNSDLTRYLDIEKNWQAVMNSSKVITENSGVGPLIFGGFSFDPKRERTSLWDKFAQTAFVLPAIMLTINENEAYITYNIFSDHTDKDVDYLLALEDELFEEKNTNLTFQPSSFSSFKEIDPSEWKSSIEVVKERIKSCKVDKVVLARELRAKFEKTIQIESVLEVLLEEQPACFVFAYERGEDCFVGASPEQLVRKDDVNIHSMCLAGSIARGKTVSEDEMLGELLLSDDKNLKEHDFVVQMIRSSLSQLCSEVTTGNTPELYKLKHIQHLYTPVQAKSNEDISIFQLVEKLHPTPALGGHPKDISLETIREVESLDRGWYAGPIGWVNWKGDGEFAVAIRSALLQGKEASLFAGCGIVEHSDPESEYEETRIKFKPMLSALGGIRQDDNK